MRPVKQMPVAGYKLQVAVQVETRLDTKHYTLNTATIKIVAREVRDEKG